jgi:transposase
MEKQEIVELIEKNYSQREIAKSLNTSQGNLKHWMKKFNVKTKLKSGNKRSDNNKKEKFCSKCKTVKPLDDFYNMMTKNRTHEKSGYCKKCSNNYHTERVRKVKIKMIEYKGGECERCELPLEKSHYSVFDFHHIDPDTKDPNFKKIKFQKWEFIKQELDKCKLVCSNCHRIIHAEIRGY